MAGLKAATATENGSEPASVALAAIGATPPSGWLSAPKENRPEGEPPTFWVLSSVQKVPEVAETACVAVPTATPMKASALDDVLAMFGPDAVALVPVPPALRSRALAACAIRPDTS